MNSGTTARIKELAPVILQEIRKASSILLHCHPSPDPDSLGSVLAMKEALEQLGKKVTAIRGDSAIPEGFSHFPGVETVVPKNFFDINPADFDLFIVLDSGGTNMISRYKPVELPLAIRSVVVDHHRTNPGYADVNLIEPSYPATSQILFDLFEMWQVKVTPDMARNLFAGIYADTGGFKYEGTTERTFATAGKLAAIAPDFPETISLMENSNTPAFLAFMALALGSIEVLLDGRLGLSVIPHAALREKGIPLPDVRTDAVSPLLRSVRQWKIAGILIELEPGKTKMSFRSGAAEAVDVSKLAAAFGGGGHAAAAGATVDRPIAEAKAAVVAKAKELYNL